MKDILIDQNLHLTLEELVNKYIAKPLFLTFYGAVCALSIATVLYQSDPLLACCFYLYLLVCFVF